MILPPKIDHLWLSTAYLPPIEYVARMAYSTRISIEQWENYQKQTFRNRCVIAAAGGPLALTLPVEKPSAGHSFTKDIRISDHGNWRHLHWNALVSAYQSTPFFEYYADDFAPFYEKRWDFLLDYNEELLRLICFLIGFEPLLQRTTSFLPERENQEGVSSDSKNVDLRGVIHPKRPTSKDFKPSPYYQVFAQKHGFQPNLSSVDLLFNMGPESILVLRDSFPGQ